MRIRIGTGFSNNDAVRPIFIHPITKGTEALILRKRKILVTRLKAKLSDFSKLDTHPNRHVWNKPLTFKSSPTQQKRPMLNRIVEVHKAIVVVQV